MVSLPAIDEGVRRQFTYGACAGLAIALHDLTGWPLIKVTDAENVYTAGGVDSLADASLADRASMRNVVGMGSGGLHWMVAHPGGRLLDIDGLRDADDVVEAYDLDSDSGVAALGTTDRDDAVDEYVIAKGEPVPLTSCALYARAVLATLTD